MIFASTRLEGALLIDIERNEDERGFFARTWCRQELAARGLDTEIAQESVSMISERDLGWPRYKVDVPAS
jgi:dTDP-4-dehydrorhamnose 3,5-epimerase